MWSSVSVKARGAVPIAVEDLRKRLRIDTTAEDDLLAAFLASAASEIDGPNGAGVAMMAQTWTLALDAWCGEIKLPGWPVTEVLEVRYLDALGQPQVLDHAALFRLVASKDPARLVRRAGVALPAVMPGPGVIEIDYRLGCEAAEDVEPGLIAALALIAGHYYENREATASGQVVEVPLGAQHILARFRRGVVA